MKETAIYVMTHKRFHHENLPQIYIPLHVGAAISDDLGYLRDDTGDNISAKNRNYCELTGLYWMWKHASADIVGLCHYRRYFSTMPLDRKLKYILPQQRIALILEKADIILPYPVYYRMTVGEQYRTEHMERDYQLTREAIQKVAPDYITDYDAVMGGHTYSQCNMFIMNKTRTDQYCRWLFSVYDYMEKYVDLEGYSKYQARMYGFMSERLLNVWVRHNALKTKYMFSASTELDYVQAVKLKVQNMLRM